MPDQSLPSVEAALEYGERHFGDFVDALKALARIPSISFDGFPPQEVARSADAVAAHLKASGIENVEILKIEGAHPYVYGDWLHAPGKPTLLLYAHHDVQPTGRDEVWKTPPFEPTEVGERLFGRGCADDKAGIIVHTSAILSYLRTGAKLPVNVKLLIEGEEEIGSTHLESFLEKYRKKVQADVIILTDTSNFDTGIPTITTSLRGLVALDVEVHSTDKPLHSGGWGGPVPDPVIALSKMLATLLDDNGRIAIPGFYDDVRPLNDVEKESLEKLNYSDDDLRKQAGFLPGVKVVGGKENAQHKMTRLPSIAVNAIQASSRKNAANIINDVAWCKIGVRTVPDQDAKKVSRMLQEHLKKHAPPWGVDLRFSEEVTGNWWMTNPEGPAFQKAADALSKAFGHDCVYLGSGGSIPFVGPFAKVLGGAPALLIGVEDPYSNAHAENESVHLGDLRKSILGAIHIYDSFGRDPKVR